MGISLGSNFDIQTALPLDSRLVVADTTARDAIAALRRYEGMIVYSEADETNYQLVGGIANGDWVQLSGDGLARAFASYADDAAYVTAKGSAAADGDVYYNTTIDLLRVYFNGVWGSVGASTKLQSYADDAAFVTANGTAADGDIYYNTTDDVVKVYADGAWTEVGAGGGGGVAVTWFEDSNSPLPLVEYGAKVYSFAAGESQILYGQVRVPESYVPGDPIGLRTSFYANASTDEVLFRTISTLIRQGFDQMSSSANQHTSTNTAVTLAGSTERPNPLVLDLTDAIGEINAEAVSPGDLIMVQLIRFTGTSTEDAKVPAYANEVTFT